MVSRLLSSGSLVVIAPTVEDTAEYECVVSNEAGKEARAIQLTVQGEYLQYGRPSEHSLVLFTCFFQCWLGMSF